MVVLLYVILQIKNQLKSKNNKYNNIYFFFFIFFNKNSTLNLKKSIDENTRFLDNQMLPCILIVNKIDLVDDDFIQNDNEIKKFAKDNNFDNLFKTSAKLGIGIDESMDYLIKNILERVEKFNNSNEKKPVEKNRLSLVLEKKKISDEKININNDCC